MKRAAVLFAFPLLAFALCAQAPLESGEEAIAARYLAYALGAVENGRWQDAETTLVRASDYAGNSSELSYYLAVARRKLGRPIGSVLEATRRSLEAARWTIRSPEDARLLEAECLLDLRSFDEVLSSLSGFPESSDSVFLLLRALRGGGNTTGFLVRMKDALAAYPRDTRLVRLLFNSVGKRVGSTEERKLIDLAVERVPFLLADDPFLAVLSAPFVRDIEDRRRLVAAYRASASASSESIPIALELGLVQERDAVEELFAQKSIDLRLLTDTYSKLGTQDARLLFSRRCASFTGIIAEDQDGDGLPESKTEFYNGDLRSFAFDVDQDRVDEWVLNFSDGLPATASITFSAEKTVVDSNVVPRRINASVESLRAELTWERYPYVATVKVGEHLFHFPPRAFPFAPIRLLPIIPASATRVPKTDPVTPRLTERSLYSFASSEECPGSFAQGSVELIEYSGGIPRHSRETVNGKTLAVTDFSAGFPSVRKLDFDLDGRFETIQRYKKNSLEIETIETDFDGDGVFQKDTTK